MTNLYETDADGKLQLHLHHGQTQAWDSQKRFVFILAGTQSGKTSFLPWLLWREIQRCGGGDYLAVSPTFPLLDKKMLPEFLKVFHHTLHLGKWWAANKTYEIFNPETGRVQLGFTIPCGRG